MSQASETTGTPLYFFDLDDGETQTRDEVGYACASREELRVAAISALPELARDTLPDGDRTVMQVKVRDESGRHIFHASLSLVVTWLD